MAFALMASTALGGALAMPVGALAQQPGQAGDAGRMEFTIPAQPLPSALDAFARQTGWQVGYASALATGRTSSAVNGTMTPARALETLLAGTGLGLRMAGPSTASIVATGDPAPAARPSAATGAMMLDPVTVSAAGHGSGIGQTLITQDDLDRKNPTDIRDVFAGEPSIRVGSSVPMSQKVYVNGVEETNLAVTVDGSRQNNKVFHHNGTTLIDPAFLKVVRVDAGVAPADAGPGALAGAIAYETKDARDLLEGDGVGAFVKSTLNTNGPSLTTSGAGYGRHQGFEALGYATYGKGGRFEAGNGETVRGTATDLVSGLGKVAMETEAGSRFQLSYEQVRDDASRPFRANIGAISGRPAWEPRVRDYRLDRKNAVFTFTETRPTELWDPKVVLAYGRSDVDTTIFTRPVGASTVPGSYPGGGETSSLNGKVENRFSLGFGSITAGADFYRDEGTYEDETYSVGERANNTGLYAQARVAPVDRLRLSTGLRGDRQVFEGTTGEDWTNSGVSYNASGEFDLHPEFLTAKAGYSHSWGGIPLAENFIMNTAWRYGARGPEPVTSDNVTAGLEARYQGVTAEGRVFRTDIDDARAARFAVASATQAHDVRSEGYEIGIGYAWNTGYVRAKYADIDVTINGQPADSDTGTYLATPMGRILTLGGAHAVADWNLTFGADLEIVLDYDDVLADQRPLEGYEVFNLFVEYQPSAYSNLLLRADIRNLFDETYADRATYGQEFGTVTPLYQPGRAFLFTASAQF
ncbi:TonB-dependent receptor [Arenibaculum pallidiluteum]|uniref:TonB-dependent receptor n=1 Tax=Arenibaculum pallidiluteum TaxID=2812559 RepID=UPI001F19A255|nr:TonB-dependent receptor [Arenibaculum pallidiluteum]